MPIPNPLTVLSQMKRNHRLAHLNIEPTNEMYKELQKYQIVFGSSRSNDHISVSPKTRLRYQSTEVNPFSEGKLSSVQDSKDAVTEQTSQEDASDFGQLFQATATKKEASRFIFEPHGERAECYCYHCENSRNAAYLDAHEPSEWCSCIKCDMWRWEKQQEEDGKYAMQEAEEWQRRMKQEIAEQWIADTATRGDDSGAPERSGDISLYSMVKSGLRLQDSDDD